MFSPWRAQPRAPHPLGRRHDRVEVPGVDERFQRLMRRVHDGFIVRVRLARHAQRPRGFTPHRPVEVLDQRGEHRDGAGENVRRVKAGG